MRASKQYTKVDDSLYHVSDRGKVLCSLCATKDRYFITAVHNNLDGTDLRCDDCRGYIWASVDWEITA